ncbi:15024_t:CDS:1, partial [Racocetra persica]
IVLAENARMQIRIYELEQRIHALNADKDELRSRNEELVTERNQFEADNIQIHAANENLM